MLKKSKYVQFAAHYKNAHKKSNDDGNDGCNDNYESNVMIVIWMIMMTKLTRNKNYYDF